MDAAAPLPATPHSLVARFLLRHLYRVAAGRPATKKAVLLLGSYTRKFHALSSALDRFHRKAVMMLPRKEDQHGVTADALADVMDQHGFGITCVVPLLDCAVAVSDVLNARLRVKGNDPETSSLRRDKFEQQEALRAAGLPAARQRRVRCPDEAAAFLAEVEASGGGAGGAGGSAPSRPRVVVKPSDGSAGEGTWLCRSEAEVRRAVGLELGRTNTEGAVNEALVVMEFFEGEDWVVNSVSLEGEHRATDVWRGPPKVVAESDGGGPARFVYSTQVLAGPDGDGRRDAVLAYAFGCLDALGLRHGAAHTELTWTASGPRLLEVNARAAGGLPRTPSSPNQLEAMALAMHAPEDFRALPLAPAGAGGSTDGRGAAVVFLRAPFDGYLAGAALEAFADLRTFSRFERNDYLEQLLTQPVRRTTGLITSPGAVVLIGDPAAVLEDVEAVRAVEATAYSLEPPPEDLDEPP